MMNRLFFKIFAWFWVAQILLGVCVGWGVKLYLEQAYPLAEQLPHAQVTAITLSLEQHGNSAETRSLLESLNRDSDHPTFVIDRRGRDILGRPVHPHIRELKERRRLFDHPSVMTRAVILPGGERYIVVAFKRGKRDGFIWPARWVAVLIALIISTLVCIWLARYLSKPISRLQKAARTLADGDFAVRVGDLRGRKDEIADLAADFDAMAVKIQQLLQGRQQLLQDISHELRSPLARMQVALELTRRQYGDSVELDRIERDLLRLEELIGEVLTLSRAESSLHEQRWEPVDIHELVSAAIRDLQLEADQRPCRLRVELEQGITLPGNAELLRRAVENILRNAVKYTADNSEVSVALKRDADQVVVEVCDQGPGIPDSQLETIFDPFVRLDNARERLSGGYGLGLAIAKKATQVHQGTIEARNRKDAGGLCVRLRLPTQASRAVT